MPPHCAQGCSEYCALGLGSGLLPLGLLLLGLLELVGLPEPLGLLEPLGV
jgi:hypothetical protein